MLLKDVWEKTKSRAELCHRSPKQTAINMNARVERNIICYADGWCDPDEIRARGRREPARLTAQRNPQNPFRRLSLSSPGPFSFLKLAARGPACFLPRVWLLIRLASSGDYRAGLIRLAWARKRLGDFDRCEWALICSGELDAGGLLWGVRQARVL